jgi:hypothetical protein
MIQKWKFTICLKCSEWSIWKIKKNKNPHQLFCNQNLLKPFGTNI